MVFSSLTFLYYFLPAFLIIYFLTPMPDGSARLRNIVLLLGSLIFYAWGEPIFVLILIIHTIIAWIFGILLDKKLKQNHLNAKANNLLNNNAKIDINKKTSSSTNILFAITLLIGLAPLIYFKYADFFLKNISNILELNTGLLGLALPIGISFYTFQTLSYLIDLKKGNITVQKNLLDFSTYVAMFPQLTAGPIVRYFDVSKELSSRIHSLNDIGLGLRRFLLGLGKKVLIANVMGEMVSIYKTSGDESVLFAWLYIIAFSLQIYFDFSGYSDMAIGLGRMFGFKFKENFNYPYIAVSLTDFWRRWHISLSSWFRDYVYIPMGGSRTKMPRHIFNILIVWFLTGFWHGAGWNFISWGLYFALILILEHFFLVKLLMKLPKILRHIYVLLLIMIGWVLFDASSIAAIGSVLGQMFGFGTSGVVGMDALYYLRSYLVPLMIGFIACTPLPKKIVRRFSENKSLIVLEPLGLGLLLVVITAYLIDGSFNPFIYFRF